MHCAPVLVSSQLSGGCPGKLGHAALGQSAPQPSAWHCPDCPGNEGGHEAPQAPHIDVTLN